MTLAIKDTTKWFYITMIGSYTYTHHSLVITQINIGSHLGICHRCSFNDCGKILPVLYRSDKIIPIGILFYRPCPGSIAKEDE